MPQTKQFNYATQFSLFSEQFKPRVLFLNFIKNGITVFSSQFSLKRQRGLKYAVYL